MAASFCCFLSPIDFERNVPNDFQKIRQQRVRLCRGNGVPCTQIGIVYTFLRVTPTPYDMVGKIVANFPYFMSSSRMPCSERSKNISMIFSSSIITPPPFRLHLYTTVLAANTTSNLKLFQKNYTTSFWIVRDKLSVCAFAASLAALRRFSLYGAVSEKAQPLFADCALLGGTRSPISRRSCILLNSNNHPN